MNTTRTFLAAALLALAATPGLLAQPSAPQDGPKPADAGEVDDAASSADAPAEQPEGDHPPEDVRRDVGIVAKPDAELPLDLTFRDAAGNEVTLGTYFRRDRPVILNFVYFRCPSMCGVILNEIVKALQQLEWTPGEEFDVVTVSINPQETANLARENKAAYLEELDREGAGAGWHFLTGSRPRIRALADAAGFNFEFDTRTQEYAHSAGIFICTPDGRISRPIFGAMYDPGTLRLSLVEAADGEVGSTMDRIVLYCYAYNPETGRYTAVVMNIMRLAGLATVVILGSFIGGLWLKERRRAATSPAAGDSPSDQDTPASSGRPAP